MGNQPQKQILLDDIQKKNIPDTQFSFRNMSYKNSSDQTKEKPLYPIFQYCQICGCQRYSMEQIKLFSDPNLTAEQYFVTHKQPGYLSGVICDKQTCATNLYVITGGYNNYSMCFAFDDFNEARKWESSVKTN